MDTEILNTIVSLIGSLGFPIVCCIIMFFQNSKLRESIDNNSKVISELANKLDDIKKE